MTAGATLTSVIIGSAARGAVLLALAFALLWSARRNSAARRHAILLGAIVAQLLIPLFAMAPGDVAASFVPQSVAVKVGSAESALAVNRPVAASVRPAAAGRPVADPAMPPAQSLFLAWLAGATIVALWVIGGQMRVRRAAGSPLTPNAAAIHDTARAAARMVGEHRAIRLLLSDATRVPMTWGIVRPTIVLPAEAPTWSRDRLRVVMLHESAHIARNDACAQLAASVALIPFWFNPLLWIAARQLRAIAERAADDVVMAAGVPPSTYVDTLLDMVAQLKRRWVPDPTLAMARRGEFEGRMMAVLDKRTDRTPLGRRSAIGWIGAAVIAAGLLGIVRGRLSVPSTALAAQSGPGSRAAEPDSLHPRQSLLSIAERLGNDIATEKQLEKVVASGPLDGNDVDRYLAIVDRIRRPIPRGLAIRTLVNAEALDSARLERVLDLTAPISSQVERSITLARIAHTQALGTSYRARYYAVASSMSGPALTSALDALH
jgi:beta-lactamase regulating signal transducer with metallopeptidase domain